MRMIHTDGDALERQIRDLLSRCRETVRKYPFPEDGQMVPVHFRDLTICWDEKGYTVFDFKRVLPPELKYIADGRKRSY